MNDVGQSKTSKYILYIFLALSAIISVFPFYWMFVVGSNTVSAINKFPPVVIPGGNLLGNISSVLEKLDFWQALFNSFIISATITISVLFFCSLAGFAFSKLKFKGRDILFVIVIATMMIPPQLSLIPNFILISKLGWVDSLPAVIVPGLVTAFGVFWMRQFISSSVPYELVEAGRMDGSSNFRIFWSIVLPIAKPGIATLGIFTFMGVWNDFLWPLVVLKDSSKHTIQIALRTLNDVYSTDYSLILAGTFMATIPVLIIFLLFNKQFIEGVTEGAIK